MSASGILVLILGIALIQVGVSLALLLAIDRLNDPQAGRML